MPMSVGPIEDFSVARSDKTQKSEKVTKPSGQGLTLHPLDDGDVFERRVGKEGEEDTVSYSPLEELTAKIINTSHHAGASHQGQNIEIEPKPYYSHNKELAAGTCYNNSTCDNGLKKIMPVFDNEFKKIMPVPELLKYDNEGISRRCE